MQTRLHGWFLRKMKIVPYAELWGSTAGHPANEALRSKGREPDDPDFFIVRGLVDNVLHAAGGIEYTVGKIEGALDAEEAWVDEYAPDLREPKPHWESGGCRPDRWAGWRRPVRL